MNVMVKTPARYFMLKTNSRGTMFWKNLLIICLLNFRKIKESYEEYKNKHFQTFCNASVKKTTVIYQDNKKYC
jgi:hypothetical protein